MTTVLLANMKTNIGGKGDCLVTATSLFDCLTTGNHKSFMPFA